MEIDTLLTQTQTVPYISTLGFQKLTNYKNEPLGRSGCRENCSINDNQGNIPIKKLNYIFLDDTHRAVFGKMWL